MILELSTGAEATGASYSDFIRLENEFVLRIVGFTGSIRPSDDEEVFKMFLSWLVVTRERALSIESLFRVAGSVMAKTGRTNLTKSAGVKASLVHCSHREVNH